MTHQSVHVEIYENIIKRELPWTELGKLNGV